jgi:hypothetical protein
MPKPPDATGVWPALMRRATILSCGARDEVNVEPPVGEVIVVGNGVVQ